MEKLSLCGEWEIFIVNEKAERVGEIHKARVPGGWRDVAGLEKHEGICCYRRSFTLAAPPEKRVLLRLGGVCRRAWAAVNGRRVGGRCGLQAPFELDVTGAVRTGANLLEIYVDNRRQEDELLGLCSIYELIPLSFDGLYGPVTLELRAPEALTGLYTPIELEKGRVLFIFDTCSGLNRDAAARVRLEVARGGKRVYYGELDALLQKNCGELRLELPLQPFELWSPEHPALYDVAAELEVDGKSDVLRTRTGFKLFEARGTDFYLNGEPYYLLGYGDDFVFPDGLPPADDSGYYHHGIRRAKDYGFNFARHHSHFPFEAYLDAADELGLLIQPELALANLPREWLNEKSSAPFLEEWRALIMAYRRHPCIAAWCGGNEMEWGYRFSGELYAEAKRLDPYRPVASTDGNFMACDVDGSFDFAGIVPAEYTDYLPYRELGCMFTRDRCGKPQVVHEMGNYTTVFAIKDLPRFERSRTGSRRTEELERIIREKGCAALYELAYENSLALQKLCHKLNIERARLSPYFCGYHLWTLIDYYETTQGLLNSFYEDKAFSPEEFSLINSQLVLLWDTESCVFRAGERARFVIKLSKYGSEKPLDGTLTASLCDGGTVLGDVNVRLRLEGHGVLDAAQLEVTLPAAAGEREYTLDAVLRHEGGEIRNGWSVFAVPEVELGREREIYIHYLSRHIFEDACVPVRHFTIPQPIGEGELIVAGEIFGGMLEAVENGAAMLLLAGADTFRETVLHNSFKTPWWDPGEIWYLNHTNNSQISCVIEPHPATAMLPYTGAWRLDIFGAVEQAPAVNLDALGLEVEPLVYGVNTRLERTAYLFQLALGKGKLLVCSFNHSRADMGDIAVKYLLKSLVNYAMSKTFAPQRRLTAEQLRAALK